MPMVLGKCVLWRCCVHLAFAPIISSLRSLSMGRAPCCSKVGLHRGPWTPREDTLLTNYIQTHGEGNWRSLPKKAGLLRCGKSCRLRWMNYLRPDIKRGNISSDEDDLIIRLHILLGNRWSLIAGRLPGRTDNEIKNYWNTHLSKKLRLQGIDPDTHKPLPHGSGEANSRKKKNKKGKLSSASMTNNNNNGQINKKQEQALTKKRNKDSRDADEKKNRHTIHLPKPVRVKSFSMLPRNESFVSMTSAASDRVINNNVGDDDNNNNNNGTGGASFFIGDDECGDYKMMMMRGEDGSDDLDLGFDHHQYQLCAGDEDDFISGEHNLDKLYNEYLQVLKTTNEVADNNAATTDDDHELLDQLDSFAESFLV
uniref:Uncharacterized protein n=1 Tax=Kalanchoe fedtschenkoi TaxID=63787 RepID=A0A7N0UHM0_KALFE